MLESPSCSALFIGLGEKLPFHRMFSNSLHRFKPPPFRRCELIRAGCSMSMTLILVSA